jgi:hypothetical protein
VVPGGLWISPLDGTQTQGPVHFAAHAYPSHAGDPAIGRVAFTVWWPSLGSKSGPWKTACTANVPSSGSVYQCDANLSDLGAPSGQISASFDVYDQAGDSNVSPNGTRTVNYTPPVPTNTPTSTPTTVPTPTNTPTPTHTAVPTCSGWSAHLSADHTQVPAGTKVHMTASTDAEVSVPGCTLAIRDQTAGKDIRTCDTGSACRVSLSFNSATAHKFVAHLDSDSGQAARSSVVTISWQIPKHTSSSGVLDCTYGLFQGGNCVLIVNRTKTLAISRLSAIGGDLTGRSYLCTGIILAAVGSLVGIPASAVGVICLLLTTAVQAAIVFTARSAVHHHGCLGMSFGSSLSLPVFTDKTSRCRS